MPRGQKRESPLSIGIVYLSVFSSFSRYSKQNEGEVKKKTDVAETSYLMLGDLYIPVHLLISHIDSRRDSGRAMRLVHTMIRWYVPLLHFFSTILFSLRLSRAPLEHPPFNVLVGNVRFVVKLMIDR